MCIDLSRSNSNGCSILLRRCRTLWLMMPPSSASNETSSTCLHPSAGIRLVMTRSLTLIPSMRIHPVTTPSAGIRPATTPSTGIHPTMHPSVGIHLTTHMEHQLRSTAPPQGSHPFGGADKSAPCVGRLL
jgi:hypothetical protein